MRNVDVASAKISAKHGSPEFWIPPSRLSDIETKGIVPSIYRFYSLSVIHRKDIRVLLSWFGVDLDGMAKDISVFTPPHSHYLTALTNCRSIKMPMRFDVAPDDRSTGNLGRMVERWGVVPFTYLEQFVSHEYSYAFIGTEDLTMYPILLPGTFLQVDESKTNVARGGWKSEYERPIYFVETRQGHVCCWCSLNHGEITLLPHPLSPVAARILRCPRDAEVIGQVVGVAMRIGSSPAPSPFLQLPECDAALLKTAPEVPSAHPESRYFRPEG
jgi:hypothetical protein